MTHQDDDLLPENTSGYKLSQPKQSLAEYQKMAALRDRPKKQKSFTASPPASLSPLENLPTTGFSSVLGRTSALQLN
ncbi:hypothetical protein QBC44DRAFT_371962 [Cladorrhinum sp. PSN332]|nr:hypothetical protein QBC44DRAFT_371962 [Cladorrhinum sp. PSN332]